ncbi:MAG TPA: hypothetical protein VFQ53_03140 [Kofleriaceae bacterium]|nr:hypothetical protein [Kofleriaceae bacterium]
MAAGPGDEARAGTKGTVTAYDLDGHTVLENKVCLKMGRYSWDYVRCGNWLRDSIKFQLCRRATAGSTVPYLYQIGDGRPMRSSVYCRRY